MASKDDPKSTEPLVLLENTSLPKMASNDDPKSSEATVKGKNTFLAKALLKKRVKKRTLSGNCEFIPVPDEKVSLILGPNSETIRDVSYKSKAIVAISQQCVKGQGYRMVTLIGGKDEVRIAREMIKELLKQPPRSATPPPPPPPPREPAVAFSSMFDAFRPPLPGPCRGPPLQAQRSDYAPPQHATVGPPCQNYGPGLYNSPPPPPFMLDAFRPPLPDPCCGPPLQAQGSDNAPPPPHATTGPPCQNYAPGLYYPPPMLEAFRPPLTGPCRGPPLQAPRSDNAPPPSHATMGPPCQNSGPGLYYPPPSPPPPPPSMLEAFRPYIPGFYCGSPIPVQNREYPPPPHVTIGPIRPCHDPVFYYPR